MDDELDIQDSIIATRERRSNAGNRLRSLLDAEEPLEEDDIFLEFEDDDEFEVKEDSDESEEEDGDDEDGDGDQAEDKPRPKSVSKPRKVKVEGDDESEGDAENFSDSDSSSDGGDGEEPEDAGEQELQQQQRDEKRRKASEQKKKMLQLPVLKPSSRDAPPAKQRQRKKASEDLLAEHRRVSKRAATVKKREAVIKRLKAMEAKQAQYVAPVVKTVRRMTQEERLEEAKITEEKNIASLHYYVEQEEKNRRERRAAMLARRVPMSSFIRYVSSTRLLQPRRIFGRRTVFETEPAEAENENKENENKENENTETQKENEEAGDKGEMEDPEHEDLKDSSQAPEEKPEKLSDEVAEASKEATPQAENDTSNLNQVKSDDIQRDESPTIESEQVVAGLNSNASGDREVTPRQAEQMDVDEPEKSTLEEQSKAESNGDEPAATESIEPTVKTEPGEPLPKSEDTDAVTKSEPDAEAKAENDDEDVKDEGTRENEDPFLRPRNVEGPFAIRNRNIITLENFPAGFEHSRAAIKTILFGPRSNRAARTPKPGRPCCITGLPAKYVDPQSDIAYSSMEAYKILNLTRQGLLEWNCDIGGLYTGLRANQRHAAGVPKGFSAPYIPDPSRSA